MKADASWGIIKSHSLAQKRVVREGVGTNDTVGSVGVEGKLVRAI
jgi:hypothetical protein